MAEGSGGRSSWCFLKVPKGGRRQPEGNNCADCSCPCSRTGFSVVPKLFCQLGTMIREVIWEQVSFILKGICEREKHPKQVKWAATAPATCERSPFLLTSLFPPALQTASDPFSFLLPARMQLVWDRAPAVSCSSGRNWCSSHLMRVLLFLHVALLKRRYSPLKNLQQKLCL